MLPVVSPPSRSSATQDHMPTNFKNTAGLSSRSSPPAVHSSSLRCSPSSSAWSFFYVLLLLSLPLPSFLLAPHRPQ
ncbi:uncharacterized protein BDV14DRAFT_17615 [Aspergillus stella-maris]|uniref:uncharacterized protein n=1 Tax=Aspergillus stella-maris TaxID=1810926 RepID=UPI003CCDA79B